LDQTGWISVCDGDGEVNVVGYNKVELAVRVDLFGSATPLGK